MAIKPFRERNATVIGFVGFAVIASLMLGAFKVDSLPIIGAGDTYHAHFGEIGNLKKGNEVRLAGLTVGKVRGVDLEGDHVDVKFKIDKGVKLGQETSVAVKVRTVLGSSFLALVPAGSGELSKDEPIPQERTTSPYDVVAAFSDLADTTGALDSKVLSEAAKALADVSAQTPTEFRDALDGVSALSGNLAARDDQISTLLVNLKKVATVLSSKDAELETLFKDSAVLFQALNERRDQIHTLLVSTSRISAELRALVKDTKADLKPALDNLETVTTMLRKNSASLDEALRVAPAFLDTFGDVFGSGPWWETYMNVGGA